MVSLVLFVVAFVSFSIASQQTVGVGYEVAGSELTQKKNVEACTPTCPNGYTCYTCPGGKYACYSLSTWACCGCDSQGTCYFCSSFSDCSLDLGKCGGITPPPSNPSTGLITGITMGIIFFVCLCGIIGAVIRRCVYGFWLWGEPAVTVVNYENHGYNRVTVVQSNFQ